LGFALGLLRWWPRDLSPAVLPEQGAHSAPLSGITAVTTRGCYVGRLRLGIFEMWRRSTAMLRMRLGGFGVLSMPCPGSTGRTVSCGLHGLLGRGFLAIMRMGIRCRLLGMSLLS
jgi:hypothetical protein